MADQKTGMVPVTYFPTSNQRLFAANAQRIRNTPYARYFEGELFLRSDVLPALRAPMDHRDALGTTPDELSTLLDGGDHAVENGYCLLPDGTAYVASRTFFPGATSDMLAWWFWWFTGEDERYILWHPYTRVGVGMKDRDALTRPGLTHEQRYIGNTAWTVEYVGASRVKAGTHFVKPADWGLDGTRFAEAGIGASVLGELMTNGLRVGRMLRLAREIEGGFELRTRFWIGDRVLLGRNGLDIGPALRALGLKKSLVTDMTAYEQFANDQAGMTHLARLLPSLYREFGQDNQEGDGA
ncbi:hypothetical protein ABZS66_27075 [Dactylosporangium sp. NPDC005572]|uniref:DAPG hydrolase family protein n=1 Tax=Dactylosporangium sp. NPDC005572 TaxID=3156889 RepID=UPI0033A61B33